MPRKSKRSLVWFYIQEEQCALLEFDYNSAEFGPLEYVVTNPLDLTESARHKEGTNE